MCQNVACLMPTVDSHHIELISKTLEIVEALRDSPDGLSLQQLAGQTGQVKSSIHRILRSLARHGYIDQDTRGAAYRLGVQFLVLAKGVRAASNLVELAQPHSRKLMATFNESTYIAVLRGGRGVFVDVQETRRDLRLIGPLGAQVQFHTTAAGKAMAAFFPEEKRRAVLRHLQAAAMGPRTSVEPERIEREWEVVRRVGYAVNDEKTIAGAVFVAGPVFDSVDLICGSISIGVPKSRYSGELRKRIIAALKECCGRINGALKAVEYIHENSFEDEGSRNASTAVRPMTADDIPAGLALCRASRWNQIEDDWRVFLESPGSGCFVAENERGVLGTAAFLRYDKLAWIALMLVDARERGSGAGTQLLEHVLAQLRDEGAAGLDATPAGEPLYRRHGFVKAHRLLRMKSKADRPRFKAGGAARPMAQADLPQVFARDREIFGADRSWLLQALFRRAPQCAWISTEGYCFGRPGHLYTQIGPIVAEREAGARDLASHSLFAQHGRPCVIDAPDSAPGWLSWLEFAGFTEERPFIRMHRGAGAKPLSPRVYGIAGPEFG